MNRLVINRRPQMIRILPTIPQQPKPYSTSDQSQTKINNVVKAEAEIQNEHDTSPPDSMIDKICLLKGTKLFKPLYYTREDDDDDSTCFLTLGDVLRDTANHSKQTIITKFNSTIQFINDTRKQIER